VIRTFHAISSREGFFLVAVCSVIQAFSVQVIVGTTLPAMASASGRCVSAYLEVPENELERRFRDLRWQSPPSFATWREQVRDARTNGYGLDKGNFFRGVTVLSVPIEGDRGPVTRCLAAAGLTEQLSNKRIKKIVRTLSEAARRVEVEGQQGLRPVAELVSV
jgi:DNA-binding IclR family transcriptional regulator